VIAILILSPFVAAIPAAWLAHRYPARAGWLAIWPAILAAFLATRLPAAVSGTVPVDTFAWASSLGLTLSFHLDSLGLLFALLITGIGALVVLYASSYLDRHASAGRFYASLFAFMGAMLGVALGDNVLTLFVFWELTGFTSFLLIGFEHERQEARSAAVQALIVTGAGGLALLAAGILLFDVTGTTSLAAMTGSRATIVGSPLYAAAAILVLLAAFTKSAQFPFHFWLPNAMAAPTPISAYLHSATMVKAGVYLIARMTPVLGGTPLWAAAVTIAGATTMIVGACRAVQEVDLKRVLAYSTVSALGVMTMLLGVGTEQAVIAALVYLLAHAGYKGALFLIAGGIDHATGTRDITMLGGLGRTMPRTAIAGAAAALSMAGVPLTLGFIGKDGAYEALLHAPQWAGWLLGLMILASVLLGLAGLLAGVVPFTGTRAAARDVHEADWRLWLPPAVLAAGGVLGGIVPFLLDGPVAAAAGAIAGAPSNVSLAVYHGATPALMLSAATLAAVGLAFAARGTLRLRTWKPAIGTEQLYDGAIRTLDVVSRVIAPPLHSASLRSYVMVIVLTAIALTGTSMVLQGGFIRWPRPSAVPVHELFTVAVVITGAVSAIRAKSTMTAVLSLGAVGYGVALIFLTFGAPDLAMTQFSVETLTVLIYVLVFRHFRALGALSPRLVRYRDALISIGIGTIVSALVLAVGTTETAPRLREYFATFAPTLGHGRNIVNVILVDFRGFDTLGEITVLATAAIGVRALLRLAMADGLRDTSAVLTSSIFRTAVRLLMPLLLLFAVFLLLRGHNEPGGGVVGGLVAAAAFALYGIAFGAPSARRALLVRPLTLLGVGLLLALTSGLPAVIRGEPFLTAQWSTGPIVVGTPAVFDAGVFLVVAGVALMMIFNLEEEP
jgi:multicomponent Na+:H+ antiporter subunit A